MASSVGKQDEGAGYRDDRKKQYRSGRPGRKAPIRLLQRLGEGKRPMDGAAKGGLTSTYFPGATLQRLRRGTHSLGGLSLE